jgi:formylglycine-generating enzyme required for sulfatase activity
VTDLSGNVWEWCLNKYDHPDLINPDSSGDRRMLRGGSWLGDPELARAAGRVRLDPGLRDRSLGFRVLLSAPIN